MQMLKVFYSITVKKWKWKKNNNKSKQNLKSIFILGMSYNSSEEEWNILFQKYVNESNAEQKLKYMHGLTGIRDTKILMK